MHEFSTKIRISFKQVAEIKHKRLNLRLQYTPKFIAKYSFITISKK